MRTGLSVSAVAHVALIALAIMGLGMGKPLEPTVVESIAVDLVPTTDFTNIRVGSLDSTVVDTETPSAVDADKPAELAKPTGNTSEDQPTPKDNPDPTPAPTEQTAPAPVPTDPTPEPEPAPDPAPADAAAPPPDSASEPEPDPAPQPPSAPDQPLVAPVETPDPADAAPRPVMKTASLQQKRADFKKQQDAEKQRLADEKKKAEEQKKADDQKKADEAKKAADAAEAAKKKAAEDAKKAADKKKADEQKRIEQAKADAAAKAADEVANLINNEDSRGATTGDGGQKTLGKADGRAATLSKSQIDGLVAQIRGCMNVPAGASDSGLTAQLEFSIDASGMVTSLPRIVSSPASSLEQALASAAQRAVMRCGPYSVTGQDVRATFDPREF